MSKRVLVIDPGEATGWAIWELPESAPARRLVRGVVPDGIDGFIPWLHGELDSTVYDLIICESFRLDKRAHLPDIISSKLEGALEALVWCAKPSPEIVYQPNSDKAAGSDKDVKRLGLWVTGRKDVDWTDGRDVNDTSRHMLAYIKNIEHLPSIEAFWPDDLWS